MTDDISDPAYPDDLRAIQRQAFGMMTGFYCGWAFKADDVRPLFDEIVQLRAENARLELELATLLRHGVGISGRGW